MHRTVIQIARIRVGDIRVGDVVCGHPDQEQGWFKVLTIRELPSGDLVAAGELNSQTVKGTLLDLVGLQVTKQVDVPTPDDGTNRASAAPPSAPHSSATMHSTAN